MVGLRRTTGRLTLSRKKLEFSELWLEPEISRGDIPVYFYLKSQLLKMEGPLVPTFHQESETRDPSCSETTKTA